MKKETHFNAKKSGSGDCRREHSATAAPGGNNCACEKEEIFQNRLSLAEYIKHCGFLAQAQELLDM